jgi:hypothetical protein
VPAGESRNLAFSLVLHSCACNDLQWTCNGPCPPSYFGARGQALTPVPSFLHRGAGTKKPSPSLVLQFLTGGTFLFLLLFLAIERHRGRIHCSSSTPSVDSPDLKDLDLSRVFRPDRRNISFAVPFDSVGYLTSRGLERLPGLWLAFVGGLLATVFPPTFFLYWAGLPFLAASSAYPARNSSSLG